MKFKSKPVKVEQHLHLQPLADSSGSDLDNMSDTIPALHSPLHASLQPSEPDFLLSSTSQQSSPNRSADEDSGVGGSPGSRPSMTHSCHMCNKKFSRADILRKHVKTAHTSTSCTVCGQLFNDKVALAKHQVEVHSSSLDRVYQCPQCEKGFKEHRTLKLHLKIHNAEYPEQCSVCQKVFRTKWQLKQHQMDHGGERPYPCPECSFTCKTKQQLNEHRRKHSGEKAYSCEQCGTRFTYRNGLIKHKKLNRCPKKIITPEGETIIKKRSRTFAASSTSHNAQAGSKKEALKPIKKLVVPPPRPSTSSLPTQPSTGSASLEPSITPGQAAQSSSVNGTLLVQNNQIQLQTQAGTYGLALLEDGSLIATPQPFSAEHHHPPLQQPPPQIAQHQTCPPMPRLLHPNVIAALSAATGLSAQEISSWAAHLPAGSTVKVTHHFDQPPTTAPAAPAAAGQPALVKTSTSYDHALPPSPSKAASIQSRQTASSQTSAASNVISTEMASACCHDSLISSCVGLPSYQESFAVDPNEVLSKDRLIKSRASFPANHQGTISPVEPSLANSRLLSLPPELSSLSSLSTMNYSDFDIDLDDIDVDAVHSLNDQEFTSIRSIVEQTFKDGRDVLDIISAV